MRVARWADATDESLLWLSVITLGEIRKGIERVFDPNKRARLESFLLATNERFAQRIVVVDARVADRWGCVTARAEGAGRKLPAIDSLIAASALALNLTLVTRNVRDFSGIELSLLDPWQGAP